MVTIETTDDTEASDTSLSDLSSFVAWFGNADIEDDDNADADPVVRDPRPRSRAGGTADSSSGAPICQIYVIFDPGGAQQRTSQPHTNKRVIKW